MPGHGNDEAATHGHGHECDHHGEQCDTRHSRAFASHILVEVGNVVGEDEKIPKAKESYDRRANAVNGKIVREKSVEPRAGECSHSLVAKEMQRNEGLFLEEPLPADEYNEYREGSAEKLAQRTERM